MLSHVLQSIGVFNRVKNKMPLGADNNPTPGVLKRVRHEISMSIALAEAIYEILFAHPDILSLFDSGISNQLARTLFRAVWGEAFAGGNCDSQSALVYFETLKAGVHKSIEMIYLRGVKINGKLSGHIVTVLNRDAKTSPNKPKMWNHGDLVINDTWRAAEKTTFFAKGQAPQVKDLFPDNFFDFTKLSTMGSFCRVEGNLTAKDWEKLVMFLSAIKKIISIDLITQLILKHKLNTQYHPKWFFDKIQQQIDIEIEALKQLAKNPITQINIPMAINLCMGDQKSETSEESRAKKIIAEALHDFKPFKLTPN